MLQTQTKLQELTELLNHSNQDKIIFPDEIKIAGSNGLTYIPKLKKVMGNWLAECQTNADTGFRNINQLHHAAIEAIYNRVELFTKKRKVA